MSDKMITDDDHSTGVATVERPTTKPADPKVDRMPLWKVLLHNDDVNDIGYVVETIVELTSLNGHMAVQRMIEAHTSGLTLLMTTHHEHAELLEEQFMSKRLTVTIEPD